jgi:hypothetical protein
MAIQIAPQLHSVRPATVSHGRQLWGERKIIGAILGYRVVERILTHLVLQARALPR